MNFPIGFKRLGLAVAVAIAAVVCLFAAVSLLIPTEKVRQAVQAEIRDVTGLDFELGGDAVTSLFPLGSISFHGVSLRGTDAGAPALSAETLTARLRFLPLLIGQVETAEVALIKPDILIAVGPSGESNWSPILETLARTLRPGAAARRPFSEIRVTDGHVRLHLQGAQEEFSEVNLSVAWPSITRSFGATGDFSWRRQHVDGSLTVTNFDAALTGDRSGLKLRLASPLAKTAFDGAFSRRPTFKLDGTFAADTPALRDALNWTLASRYGGGGLGPFAIKGQARIANGLVSLNNANLELDGNSAEGVLSYTPEGRQTLQGTLAADALDLTPYLSPLSLFDANQRDWNRRIIALEGLRGMEADLRLSAGKVAIARAKLGRSALGVTLRNGRLNVTVGESQAYGGIITGAVALGYGTAGAEFKAQLRFADILLESALPELIGNRALEGRGDLSLMLETSGANMLELARAVGGSATLTGRDGALVGFNVEQLMRRLERRPLSGAGDFRSGRTPFRSIAANVRLVQGQAQIDNAMLDGPTVRVSLNGTATIPTRDLDLKGAVALLGSGGSDAGFELPFVVQGSWDDPLALPDPQALIRRSPASAPLLRSVIERLTGASSAPKPAP